MTMVIIHPPTGLPVVIESDELGWLIGYVPELPGCVAQGRTVEEAVQNIFDAIEDVLEVIRQDDPERYDALAAISRYELTGWESDSTRPEVDQDWPLSAAV